ncbi:MAG: hypothetical protein AABY95_04285 [Pseudomonadota bacterium]
MIKQSSIFALVLLSGAASAQSLTATVNGLLGTGGATAAPLTAPLGAALSTPVSMLDDATQPVTGAAPLPGLTSSKASGDTLSLGVLNQGEPLINGCLMGACMSTSDIPTLGGTLNGLGDTLNSGLRNLSIPLTTETLAAVTDPVGSGLETVVNSIPVTGATLFGGAANGNTDPNSAINAGVLSGDNAGSGGMVGAAILSTSASSNPDSSARASDIGVGVLNGNGSAPPNTVTVVDPGSSPDDNDETTQNDDESELCETLAKDNRGQVKSKLREKAQCSKTKTPKG